MLRFIFMIILAMPIFFSGACRQKPQEAKIETPENIPVKVMAAKTQDLLDVLEYAGNIKAQEEAIVYPKVSGKIMEKTREENSPINKGETIAYIDRDEVGLKFERAPVESPLSGIVGRVFVDIGVNVTPQTPIALVVDMSKVKIKLDLPEKYLPGISLGQKAEISVDAYPQEEFSGKVSKVSPVVDLNTRTAPVEISVENPQLRLNPGMFAKVSLAISEHKNATVILKDAVIGKEPDTYVYVIKDKKAILKKVGLGLRHGPYLEIKEGVAPGEKVVILGQQRLSDGASVEAEEQQ